MKQLEGAYVYLPPPFGSEAMWLQRLSCLKYYNVWE